MPLVRVLYEKEWLAKKNLFSGILIPILKHWVTANYFLRFQVNLLEYYQHHRHFQVLNSVSIPYLLLLLIWKLALPLYKFSCNHLYILFRRGFPEIKQIFKGNSHCDIITRPSKYSYFVYYICPVPDDNVPKFIISFS